ncbi:MAG TPA: ATP-binding protein [Aquirhabdus sp.]
MHLSHVPALVTKYEKRISGTLLDRIDIHIEFPRADYEKLSGNKLSESSETIRARVQAARNIQQARFTNPDSLISNKSSSTDVISNTDMRIGEIRQFCQLQAEGGALSVSKPQSLMRTATSCCTHGAVRESIAVIPACLCTAQCHCITKLARTIADLAGSENIQSTHLAEVLHLRSPEDHDVMNTFFEHDIRFINKQTLNQFYYLLT